MSGNVPGVGDSLHNSPKFSLDSSDDQNGSGFTGAGIAGAVYGLQGWIEMINSLVTPLYAKWATNEAMQLTNISDAEYKKLKDDNDLILIGPNNYNLGYNDDKNHTDDKDYQFRCSKWLTYINQCYSNDQRVFETSITSEQTSMQSKQDFVGTLQKQINPLWQNLSSVINISQNLAQLMAK